MQTWKERWLLPYRNTNYRIDEKNYYIFYCYSSPFWLIRPKGYSRFVQYRYG